MKAGTGQCQAHPCRISVQILSVKRRASHRGHRGHGGELECSDPKFIRSPNRLEGTFIFSPGAIREFRLFSRHVKGQAAAYASSLPGDVVANAAIGQITRPIEKKTRDRSNITDRNTLTLTLCRIRPGVRRIR